MATTSPTTDVKAAAVSPLEAKAITATATSTVAGSGIALSNGVVIPAIGLGCYLMTPVQCRLAVATALGLGYRHIDTAAVYRNEESVGLGVSDSKLDRRHVFITSKLNPKDHLGDEASCYAAALASLKRLGTEYFDLYLVHWPARSGIKTKPKTTEPPKSKYKPNPNRKTVSTPPATKAQAKIADSKFTPVATTAATAPEPSIASIHRDARRVAWAVCERLYREGKARAIGVSNYEICHLEEMLGPKSATAGFGSGSGSGGRRESGGYAQIPPHVNQIEVHPLLYGIQRPIIEYCQSRQIMIEAYPPLAMASTELLAHPTITGLAKQHGVTPAQVALRWALAHKHCVVLPKSVRPERMRENFQACIDATSSSPDSKSSPAAAATAAVKSWTLSSSDVAAIDAIATDPKISRRRMCWNPTNVPIK